MSSKKLISSSIIFFAGIALGLALAVTTIWPDYEAVRYFFTGAVFDPFRGMKCPAFVTRSETATISASIENPSDRVVQPVYKVEVSGPLGRMLREQISIPPHQTQKIEWTVNADDMDLRYFIFAKIAVLSFAGTPTREATCGIFVLNLNGLTGRQVLNISLAASVLGIFIGLLVWEREMETVTKGFMQPQRVRRALGVVVLLAMLSGLMGWWTAGILFCVMAVLLLVITLLAALRA